MSQLWDKLIVALDLSSQEEIKKIIKELSPRVKKFKIGPVAFVRYGPQAIGWVQKEGGSVFLDLKFYDIPNTMAKAVKVLVDLEVWAFTVHLKAGGQNLSFLSKSLRDYAQEKNKSKPLIFGVTELTSQQASFEQVLSLAKVAKEAGIEAVVCSVWEAAKIKKETGLLAVTPGIRSKPALDDQKRTATPKQAIEAGSDYFVVGRPIVKSGNPSLAAQELIESI